MTVQQLPQRLKNNYEEISPEMSLIGPRGPR